MLTGWGIPGSIARILAGAIAAMSQSGRTAPGAKVTNARDGYSWHNFGLAADMGVFKGGKYIGNSPVYAVLGRLARNIPGLEWGGDWQSLKDEPHLQLKKFATLARRLHSDLVTRVPKPVSEAVARIYSIKKGDVLSRKLKGYGKRTSSGGAAVYTRGDVLDAISVEFRGRRHASWPTFANGKSALPKRQKKIGKHGKIVTYMPKYKVTVETFRGEPAEIVPHGGNRVFVRPRKYPEKLQVWKNTTLGELWERRAVNMEESSLMERSEIYPENADLPGEPGKGAAPLLLTCGVDCQHGYMQYEIVGWGRFGESWGIRSGYIQGAPDSDEVWAQLDSIVTRSYRYTNGKELRVSATFVDSGDGNYTNEIARRTAARMQLGVFACKGDGTHGKPPVSPAKWLPIAGNDREKYPLYVLGVNAGKEAIMQAVAVQEPGANYMHLPAGEDRGYDLKWYSGLLSEVREVKGTSVKWVKLPGHERNEALDCRNYARAAYKAINPDFDAIEEALSGVRSIRSHPRLNLLPCGGRAN